jgi:hypothetical protein
MGRRLKRMLAGWRGCGKTTHLDLALEQVMKIAVGWFAKAMSRNDRQAVSLDGKTEVLGSFVCEVQKVKEDWP